MKCYRCGREMKCFKGEHHYTESGLDVILKGIEICECPCGERIVGIPAVAKLHSLLGHELIKKQSRLAGNEVRFLRKNMGMTGTALSELMKIRKETLSRWENGERPISESHDRLLRLIYSVVKELPASELKELVLDEFPTISAQDRSGDQGRIFLSAETINACVLESSKMGSRSV